MSELFSQSFFSIINKIYCENTSFLSGVWICNCFASVTLAWQRYVREELELVNEEDWDRKGHFGTFTWQNNSLFWIRKKFYDLFATCWSWFCSKYVGESNTFKTRSKCCSFYWSVSGISKVCGWYLLIYWLYGTVLWGLNCNFMRILTSGSSEKFPSSRWDSNSRNYRSEV